MSAPFIEIIGVSPNPQIMPLFAGSAGVVSFTVPGIYTDVANLLVIVLTCDTPVGGTAPICTSQIPVAAGLTFTQVAQINTPNGGAYDKIQFQVFIADVSAPLVNESITFTCSTNVTNFDTVGIAAFGLVGYAGLDGGGVSLPLPVFATHPPTGGGAAGVTFETTDATDFILFIQNTFSTLPPSTPPGWTTELDFVPFAGARALGTTIASLTPGTVLNPGGVASTNTSPAGPSDNYVVGALAFKGGSTDVIVPDVVGMAQADGQSTLIAATLGVGAVTFQYTSSLPALPPQPTTLPPRAAALGYKLVWPLDGGTGTTLATTFAPGDTSGNFRNFNLLQKTPISGQSVQNMDGTIQLPGVTGQSGNFTICTAYKNTSNQLDGLGFTGPRYVEGEFEYVPTLGSFANTNFPAFWEDESTFLFNGGAIPANCTWEGQPVGTIGLHIELDYYEWVRDSTALYGPVGKLTWVTVSGVVTHATNATHAVFTLSNTNPLNPFGGLIGSPNTTLSGFAGAFGTAFNGQTPNILSVGGSSGAWTVTTDLDTSAGAAYTSGGQVRDTTTYSPVTPTGEAKFPTGVTAGQRARIGTEISPASGSTLGFVKSYVNDIQTQPAIGTPKVYEWDAWPSPPPPYPPVPTLSPPTMMSWYDRVTASMIYGTAADGQCSMKIYRTAVYGPDMSTVVFLGGAPSTPAGIIISQSPAAGTSVAPGTLVSLVVSLGAGVTVPDVVGLTQAVATNLIATAGATVGVVTSQHDPSVPAGEVISQSIAAGTIVAPGAPVSFVLSLGPSSVGTIPDVVNTSVTAIAPGILAAAGFVLGAITTHTSATVIPGNIILQFPAAGTTEPLGFAVDVEVSSGLPGLTIPDLFGLTKQEAIDLLVSLGLVPGAIGSAPSKLVPPGQVATQSPNAGDPAAIGTIVSFVLSTGTLVVGTAFDFEQTVISQYANSPVILQLVNNLNQYIDQSTNFADFFNYVWNVETAQGFGLDVWGKIVVVSRLLQIPNTTAYVGFFIDGESQPDQDWTPAGSSQDHPPVGGAFYTGHNATEAYLLDDAAYRQLILAKAFANICITTAPAINQILQNLYGPGNAWVLNDGPMAISYNLGFNPTAIQLAILEQSGVIPTPPGVAVTINTNL